MGIGTEGVAARLYLLDGLFDAAEVTIVIVTFVPVMIFCRTYFTRVCRCIAVPQTVVFILTDELVGRMDAVILAEKVVWGGSSVGSTRLARRQRETGGDAWLSHPSYLVLLLVAVAACADFYSLVLLPRKPQ